MLIGLLDFETTGTDPLQDHVTEVGEILYTMNQHRVVESSSFLVMSDRLIPKDVEEKTGVTNSARRMKGYDDKDSLLGVLEWLKQFDILAGHNITEFDWPLLEVWARRMGQEPPRKPLLIDTMYDLPGYGPGRALQHMCADHGFLNLMPHCAMTDCQSVLALITHPKYKFEDIVERAKSPIVVLEALVSYDDRQQAKDRKFHWNDSPGHLWWKACKEMDVEGIAKECPFDVTIRRDLKVAELWG